MNIYIFHLKDARGFFDQIIVADSELEARRYLHYPDQEWLVDESFPNKCGFITLITE